MRKHKKNSNGVTFSQTTGHKEKKRVCHRNRAGDSVGGGSQFWNNSKTLASSNDKEKVTEAY